MMPNWRVILWLLLYGSGLGWVAYEVQTGPETPGAVEPEPAGPERLPPTTPTIYPSRIGEFDDMLRRPLFHPDRRPLASTPATTPKARPSATGPKADEIDSIRVSAIFSGPQTFAAIVEMANGERQVLSRGASLGAWKVLEIQDDRVTFGKGTERKVFYVPEFTAFVPPRQAPATARNARAQQGSNRPQAPRVDRTTNGQRPRRAAPTPGK